MKAVSYNQRNGGGLPVGSEVKNLPANERDEGLIPSPGRSHRLRGH